MGRKGFLGEFELLVMLAVVRIGKDAYGVRIREEIERQTGRSVARGAVYVTLDRLVRKGLLASHLAGPTPERGGKAKRFYRVEAAGLDAIRHSRAMLRQMERGIEALLEES
jgi:DNA-binding PadR family transcriptional regulator